MKPPKSEALLPHPTSFSGPTSSSGRVILATLAIALSLSAGCGGGGGGSSGPTGGPGAPTLSSISPSAGGIGGGVLVTIDGTGFQEPGAGVTHVTFGGVAGTAVTVLSDLQLQCKSPASPAGTVHVKVANDLGSATLSAAFTYLLPTSFGSDTDVNADGVPDLIVGAKGRDVPGNDSGAVYAFFGKSSGPMADRSAVNADVKFTGFGSSTEFGSSVSANDVNADGFTDVVIGAPQLDFYGTNSGAVYIFYGPFGSGTVIAAANANVILRAENVTDGDRFGWVVVTGDVNNDQVADVLVGAPNHDVPAADNGAVYVFHGGGLASGTASSANIKITGASSADRLGQDIALGDVTGDGQTDIVMSASYCSLAAGAIYVFEGGPGLASGSATSASVILSGDFTGDFFGQRTAVGDINADGVADVIGGAPRADLNGSSSGAAYVFFGGPGLSSATAGQADLVIAGAHPVDKFGDDVNVGDVNGDGTLDLLVGAVEADAGTTNNGRVYVFYGGAGVSHAFAGGAELILTGQAVTHENFGVSVQVVDLNADGTDDLFVGAARIGTGEIHGFLGGPFLVDVSAGQDDLTFSGEASGDNFGVCAASGR